MTYDGNAKGDCQRLSNAHASAAGYVQVTIVP